MRKQNISALEQERERDTRRAIRAGLWDLINASVEKAFIKVLGQS